VEAGNNLKYYMLQCGKPGNGAAPLALLVAISQRTRPYEGAKRRVFRSAPATPSAILDKVLRDFPRIPRTESESFCKFPTGREAEILSAAACQDRAFVFYSALIDALPSGDSMKRGVSAAKAGLAPRQRRGILSINLGG